MIDGTEAAEELAMLRAENGAAPVVDTPATTDPVENTDPPTVVDTPAPDNTNVTPAAPVVESTITDDVRLKAINEAWGTSYTSIDEFKAVKSTLDEVPSLKEYKTKYEQVSQTPPVKFASPVVQELNAFVAATGIENVNVSKELKLYENSTSKSPIDTLVIAEIIKDPSLIDKKELLYKQYKRQYNTTVDETQFEGDEEGLAKAREDAELVQFNLERAAQAAEKSITEVSEKVKNYKEPEAQNQDKLTETKAQWEGQLNAIYGGENIFKTIPVQVPVGKDAEGKEQFETIDSIELTPEQQKQSYQNAVDFALANNLELTPENLATAVANEWRVIQANNIPRIIQNDRAKQKTKLEAEIKLQVEKEIHNPSPIQVETPAQADSKQTAEERLLAREEKMFGG